LLTSSNFIVFPFLPFLACFFLHLSGSGKKQARNGERDRTEAEGVWQGVSESAVRDKPLLVYGLARNRRSPKRPCEPRPSGVHPGRGRSGRDDTCACTLLLVVDR
jgi:hypothetical protein